MHSKPQNDAMDWILFIGRLTSLRCLSVHQGLCVFVYGRRGIHTIRSIVDWWSVLMILLDRGKANRTGTSKRVRMCAPWCFLFPFFFFFLPMRDVYREWESIASRRSPHHTPKCNNITYDTHTQCNAERDQNEMNHSRVYGKHRRDLHP